ncbi:MAG: hypothetical protein J6W38_12065 [Prevotella sp.]|nr:hypothetical protein [Prevotella sp.]
MKSNKLEFSIGSEYGLDFVEKEHSITHDDDYGSTTMSGHTLTVNANRHGSGGVADDFKTYIGGEGHCTACMSHDDFPGKLNFAVNGTFTITLPDGRQYSNTVAVAQGHNAGSHNNWWIGGKQMYGKAVGTPVAVGVFHLSNDTNEVKEKTDETIAKIADSVKSAVENIFDSIASNIESNPDNFLEKVNTKIDEMANNICESIDNSSIFDAKFAKDFVKKLAKDIKTFIENLIQKSQKVEDFITGIGKTVAEKVNALIKDTSSAVNKKLYDIIHDIIYAVCLLFVRFDGDRYSANDFSMSIIGYQIIDNLNK